MLFSFRRKRRRASAKKPSRTKVHYRAHKELAREVIHGRLAYWSAYTGFVYNRVAIRDQKRCWGSCSAKKNLNFNYKLIFLPPQLMDYVIVHELCHLKHMDHSSNFWAEVEKHFPSYKAQCAHLKRIASVPQGGFPSSVAYQIKKPPQHVAAEVEV